jgi:ketosteroid isomerase-like protein
MFFIKRFNLTCLVLLVSSPVFSEEQVLKDPAQYVIETERRFAQTMALRDFEGFKSFLSEEAVFISGPDVLRGKQQIADAWAPYFKDEFAPFTWEPDQAVVLESGTLALSTGPVRGPDGKLVATFNSIWRLEDTNKWRIIFDKGTEACDCPTPED